MLPLHKIHWKLPLADAQTVDPWDFFRAFSAWIGKSDDILIDVADYRHVKDGTKIILVGHDADYVLDEADGVTGLVYARKMPLSGDDVERLAFALGKVLSAADRLERDAVFAGNLKFDRSRFIFIANDRAAVPNTQASFDAIQPVLAQCFAAIYPGEAATFRYHDDAPKSRLRVSVTSPMAKQ